MTVAATLTHRLSKNALVIAHWTLSLTAEERTRSRHRFETIEGVLVQLQLPRGTVLQDGDLLQSAAEGAVVKVVAAAEPVLTVRADTAIELLRAAYHLGNRHVPLEITPTYLRLMPDSVLQEMLEHRGLQVEAEVQPFQPETGAYGHHH